MGGDRAGLQRKTSQIWRVMGTFIPRVGVMVSWVCAFVRTYQTACVHVGAVSCPSATPSQSRVGRQRAGWPASLPLLAPQPSSGWASPPHLYLSIVHTHTHHTPINIILSGTFKLLRKVSSIHFFIVYVSEMDANRHIIHSL